MKKPRQSRWFVSLWKDFLRNPQTQYSILAMFGGLAFFVFPAMIVGGLVLQDLFVQNVLKDMAYGRWLTNGLIYGYVPWIAFSGILFGIGLIILLAATRNQPQLEGVFVWVGLLLELGALGVGAVVTYRCGAGCGNEVSIAAAIALIALGLLGYIIPVVAGRPVGWYALFYLPLLAYQVYMLIPSLLISDQVLRSETVVKNGGLLLATAGLGALIWLSGGWKRFKA